MPRDCRCGAVRRMAHGGRHGAALAAAASRRQPVYLVNLMLERAVRCCTLAPAPATPVAIRPQHQPAPPPHGPRRSSRTRPPWRSSSSSLLFRLDLSRLSLFHQAGHRRRRGEEIPRRRAGGGGRVSSSCSCLGFGGGVGSAGSSWRRFLETACYSPSSQRRSSVGERDNPVARSSDARPVAADSRGVSCKITPLQTGCSAVLYMPL
jgi:hypothetical protein